MTLPLRFDAGHLFITVGGASLLLDTGSPASFASAGRVSLLGTDCAVPTSYMGLDAPGLSALVKRPVDGLLGMDLLSTLDVIVDVPEGRLTLAEGELDVAGDVMPIDDVLGIPVVQGIAHGRDVRLFFDTGASIAYMQDAHALGGASSGPIDDFYPGVGPFTTNTWMIDFRLGGAGQTIRCGELPGILGPALQLAGVDGIVGNDFVLSRTVGLFTRRQLLVIG